MAFLLVLVKAVIEVAMLALLGQFTWTVRKVTPRVVLDAHIPLATLLLLVFAWVFISISLRGSCASNPAQPACERFQQVPQ